MTNITCFIVAVAFSIITVSNSHAAYYELLNDSTIVTSDSTHTLSGRFSLNPSLSLPPSTLSYVLMDISLIGGQEEIFSANFQYNVPVLWNHVSVSNGIIQEMGAVPVSQIINASTPITVTFVEKIFVPTNVLNSQYNYTSYNTLSDYWPDEVLFNYQLIENTYNGIKVDSSSGYLVPGGWDIILESSEVVGSLSIHAVNISPVPLPRAAWLLGSGLLGLAGLGRRKKAALA